MYQVLARKWRPKNFHELVGQKHVAQALTYALDHNRIHHAYLFTGTRGVGKTTIARIFAKSLNCQINQISSNPCGKCDHCLEIDQGIFPDLLEVDAASRTGVDDTRELLDNVPYAPVKGRFKVYLIDEVHMFSKSSFNALLKTLEEPPAHVKFILATTDPQKLPATILSRCLQFHLKNMSENQIAGHLSFILERENAVFEDEALRLLAHAASGSMRDSLSLLDQALAYGQGKITTHDVSTLLGAISTTQLLNLLETLINQDAKNMRGILITLDEYAPDYSALLQSFLQCLQKISIVQLDAQRPEDEIPQKLQQLAIRIPVELTQLWYQIATDTWQNLPYQPDARIALEMGFLRMIALQPILPQTDLKEIRPIPEAKKIEDDSNFADMVASLQELDQDKTITEKDHRKVVSQKASTNENIPPWQEMPEYRENEDDHGDLSSKKLITEETPKNLDSKSFVAKTNQENHSLYDAGIPPWQEMPEHRENEDDHEDLFSEKTTTGNRPENINDNFVNPYMDIPPWDCLPEDLPTLDGQAPVWEDVPPLSDDKSEVKREKKSIQTPQTTGKNPHEYISEWVNDIAAWSEFLLTLPLDNFPRMLLESCCPHDWQSPILSLFLDKKGESFYSPQNIEKAEKVLSNFFNAPCKLQLEFQENLFTPSLFYQNQRNLHEQETRENFFSHPMIEAAKAAFGDKILISNIQSTKQE